LAEKADGARVLCAGIAVQDQIFGVEAFPAPGSKHRARTFMAVPGGCAANAAIAAARLGGKVSLVAPFGGPPGQDVAGDAVLRQLRAEGVDCTSVIRMPGVSSSISAITIDPAGERTIVNYRDRALEEARLIDTDAALAGVRALLIDNRFPELVIPLCLAARAADIPVVLDADKPTRLTQEFLSLCTHIIFPADGLRAAAGCDDLSAALHAQAALTTAFLAVTDGRNGVYWLDAGEMRQLPGLSIHAVDTLGAGDVFHGAFTLALAEGQDAISALRFANTAAGLKCRRFGGITGAPYREDVERHR
jgi:sugar/nucleoside kinase (ribokinase family)